MSARQIDFDFKFVTFALTGNFYLAALFLAFVEVVRFAEIDLTGYFRFLALGITVILLLAHSGRYLQVFFQERLLCCLICSFLLLLIVQILLVEDQFLHLQGSVQVCFYLICVLSSLYSSYYYSTRVRDVLVNLAVVLFISVIIFYPYLIYQTGMLPYERIMTRGWRLHLLLGAGNEDAHFMATLSPFILAKLYRSKLITGIFLAFLFLALIYNGTLAALLMTIIISTLYYFMSSRKKIPMLLFMIMILVLAGGSILEVFSVLFERQKVLINYYDRFLGGEYLGENLSGRLALVWLPALRYTIENCFWTGFGSNGWPMVANTIAVLHIEGIQQAASPHNFFVWSFSNWGIVGLVLIICLFYRCIRYSWHSAITSTTFNERRISVAIFCSWVGFVGWCMIANSHGPYGWTVLVLLILLSISNRYHLLKGTR